MQVCVTVSLVVASMATPWLAHALCAPKKEYCQSLPVRTNSTTAIFLGVVKRVTAPPQTPPSANNPRPQSESFPSSRNQGGDPLPVAEKMAYPSVTFYVVEDFVGVTSAEFTVRLTSHVFHGNIPHHVPPFVEGETWLVEAYYDTNEQHWMTSTCERNKIASAATQDLQVLRTWKQGQRLPGWITGRIYNRAEGKTSSASATRVYLHGEKGSLLTAVTDSSGKFSFNNLEPGVYDISTGVGRSVKSNLTYGWCSDVVLFRDETPGAP